MRRLMGWPLGVVLLAACLTMAACGDDRDGSGDSNNSSANNNPNNSINNNTNNPNNSTNNNPNNPVNNNPNNPVNNNPNNPVNNNPDPVAECEAACMNLGTTCRDEFLAECPTEVVDQLIPGCQQACADENARAQITAVAGLPCATVVPLAIEGFGLADLCADEPLECDNQGFEATQSTFEYDDFTGVYGFTATLPGESTTDALLVQFYPTAEGPAPLAAGPGSYPIGATADDQSYATCTTCVLIRQGCDSEGCAADFFATGGVIEVSEVDEANGVFVAELTNVQLAQVSIDPETFESTPIPDGETWCLPTYAIDTTPECIADEDCTEAGKGICNQGVCSACATDLDCPEATPVCAAGEDGAAACLAGISECEGDDDFEEDDAAAAATVFDLGSPREAAACTGASQRELDWASVTLTERKLVTFTLSWENEDADFDLYLTDAAPTVIDASEGATTTEVITAVLEPGEYYLVVSPYDTTAVGAGGIAVPYTLGATLEDACASDAECGGDLPFCVESRCVGCSNYFDCSAETPLCAPTDENPNVPVCRAGVAECTGDDANEDDDGPTAAAALTLGAPFEAAACSGTSGLELDWTTFTLESTRFVSATLAWENADADLDLYLLNGEGLVVDSSEGAVNTELVGGALEAGTYYLVVSPFDTSAVGEGLTAIPYTLTTTDEPACADDSECSDPAFPACDAGRCVACVTSFDCADPQSPLCTVDAETGVPACGGSIVGECSGDDASEENDAPANATAWILAQELNAAICGGVSGAEEDWFSFTLDESLFVGVTLAWESDEVDLELFLYSQDGERLDSSTGISNSEEVGRALPAGTYYVAVIPFDTNAVDEGNTAVPYTLTAVTEAACGSNDDCADPNAPACDTFSGQCVACVTSFDCSAEAPLCSSNEDGPVCITVDACTGDDASENADDGPSGATPLAVGTPVEANVCGDFFEISSEEADWYTFTVEAADLFNITLSWADAEVDLDLTLVDASGEQVAISAFDQPEQIAEELEPGTYYVQVQSFFGAPTAAVPYTLTLTTP